MTMRFEGKFQCNPQPGDFLTLNVGSVEVRATIKHDGHSRPSDYECYTPADCESWRQGEWYFCGVVFSVRANGRSVDEHHESLWGIDVNNSGDYITEIANDMAKRVDLTDIALRLDECSRSLRNARDSMLLGLPV